MKPAKLKDAIAAMGGELSQGSEDTLIAGVSTDSRTTQEGDLFFAIVGDYKDGHEYVATALERGAAAAVVSHPTKAQGTTITVPDTLVALGDLAAWHRRRFAVRVVGVTGSVGKTTTKEMISAVLSSRFGVLKNEGNFNNEIGVPLTIFRLQDEHEILVQEMAMRLPGEIARLATIAGPDVGVVTNIGLSHIERLGSQDAIAQAKSELLELLPRDGLAVLNSDDPYLEFLSKAAHCEVVVYGTSAGNVQARDVTLDVLGRPRFTLVTAKSEAKVSLPVTGEHNVPNALAAVAVGLCFNLTVPEMVHALEEFSPPEKRANLIDGPGGWKILDDTYNASPASMASALKTLASMEGGRKIAVLGDMHELGEHAGPAHLEIGRLVALYELTELVTVGELGRKIAVGAREAGFHGRVREFQTSESAGNSLRGDVRSGDIVLVKGSRVMKMENVVEVLR